MKFQLFWCHFLSIHLRYPFPEILTNMPELKKKKNNIHAIKLSPCELLTFTLAEACIASFKMISRFVAVTHLFQKQANKTQIFYYKSSATSTKIPNIVRPVRSSGKANTKYTEGRRY